MAPKAHPDQVGREKTECEQCGYKCFPQWMNDKAHCLKCDAVLKARPVGGGAAGLAPPAQAAQRGASPASKLDTPLAPQPRTASPKPADPNLRDEQGRVKTECDKCGYKCYPQWMNDQAHCLKCDHVLKRRAVGGGAAAGSAGGNLATPANAAAGQRPKSPVPGGGGGTVSAVFSTFAGAGKSDMDGKSFVKLCKDCKLFDKAFTSVDGDLMFAKVAEKGQRRINLAQFEHAIVLMAAKKGVSEDAVRSVITGGSGPSYNATQTDAVRFHDDKSTYTGVHTAGGPDSVSKGMGTATTTAASGMHVGH